MKRIVEVCDCRSGRFIRGARALVDGVEIQDVFRAEKYEDGTGRVWRYKRNAEGWLYSKNGMDAAQEMLEGAVSIVPPSFVTDGQWAACMARWVEEEKR